jgi:hypothetical protein
LRLGGKHTAAGRKLVKKAILMMMMMSNGQWAMGNGQWAMGNGQWDQGHIRKFVGDVVFGRYCNTVQYCINLIICRRPLGLLVCISQLGHGA